MRKELSYHRLLLGAGLAVVIAACGDNSTPKPAPVAQAVKKPEAVASTAAAAAAAAAAAPAPYVYAYNPVGKRDPFRSPKDERLKVNDVGDCAEVLCGFDVEQLTLVGVVTGDANPEAMVYDPQGRGHILRRNTRVGRQGGRVTQILRDSVTVTQLWTGPDGKVNPNPVMLKLAPDKGSEPVFDYISGRVLSK